MDGSRSPSSGRLLALVVTVLVVTALASPAVLGAPTDASDGLGSNGVGDGLGSNELGDGLEIDEELENATGTVEVVVRLEEPDRPDSLEESDVESYLEEHAEESQEDIRTFAEETNGVEVQESFWVTNALVLELDTALVDLDAFEQFDAATAVHENFELPPPDEPSVDDDLEDVLDEEDDSDRTTGGISELNATGVWDRYDTRGEGARVAVLDTGVDAEHPDIDLYTDDPDDPTYPGGWAEFDAEGSMVEDSTPYDSDRHGTHVSGTVAGGNASGEYIGVAPEAELLHGLVLTDEGGTFAQMVAGMEWALEEDADAISMSLGADGRIDELIDPVQNVESQGTVVVAAIGNDGPETSSSPANLYGPISVGASDPLGGVAPFSGGETIDSEEWENPPEEWPDQYVVPNVVAPGVFVESAVPGDEYDRLSGTSMATPHVSGTVALLRSIEPDATHEEIETALTETASKPVGSDSQADSRYGHGIVDAGAAAHALAGAPSPGDGSDGQTADDSDSSGDASTGDGMSSTLESAGGDAVTTLERGLSHVAVPVAIVLTIVGLALVAARGRFDR